MQQGKWKEKAERETYNKEKILWHVISSTENGSGGKASKYK